MNPIVQSPSPSSTRSLNVVGVDLAAVKARQQQTWASGDFAVIGTTLQLVGESLCEAADLQAGSRVLDVACGNGNAALAAAHRFGNVVGIDYVPALLQRARERAAAERLTIDFVEGDAEALPFPEGSFDVVLSTFGVMFAPDQQRAARELTRVVRRGGTIALANWTPEGFIGQLFKVIGAYLPPPAGLKSPALWGTEPHIVSLFGSQAADIRCVRRQFNFRYRSSAHFIQVFRDFYGPMLKAFAALDEIKRAALERDITDLLERLNTAGRNWLVVPAEYLEIVIIKR